ncbi:rhomboid family intramembrane serine protease [Microtetraspora fusca]|uniref:rhomboid family intramembrane serine protease n=1 Tax=Microtetraspora fusca TaxID=1997 RepID=UPI00147247A6|nr:rhomboid family intramembrane serine protease [Microtetraspora fusca]
MKKLPAATAAVFAVTAVPSLLQFALPSLEIALRRDPARIADGEWWRLGTSLLVQGGGPVGAAFNLVSLLVLGAIAERALGPARWIACYLAGAAAGQAAGTWLGLVDAGNSIGVCGLAGGLAVAVALGRADRLAGSVAAFYALLLVGGLFSGSVTVIVATSVIGAAGVQLVVHRDRLPIPVFPAIVVATGLVLAVLADLHGPALLSGAAVAGVVAGALGAAPRSVH